MNTLNVYTNKVYNGKEIDNWKKAWPVSNFSELINALEVWQPQINSGEILHIVDDWTYEDVTEKVLVAVEKYKELLKQIEELESSI